MEKYAVIIDSTVYLLEEEIKKYDITKVSLNVIDGEETFKESEITPDFVFSRQDKGHVLTTSQPSPGEFLSNYEKLQKLGYEKVFVICLSKELSGTYQSATLAQNMLDNVNFVFVFNSGLGAFGNEMLVLKIIEMIKSKKDAEKIIEKINNLISTSNLIFTLETLSSLIRSGRLTRAKAVIGSVLRIKPLIQMIDGKLDFFKSARTHKKVFEEIIRRIKETTLNANKILVRVLGHNSSEHAEALIQELKRKFDNIEISYNDNNLGPIFCLHLGKKGYGVSWCTE